jgi:hypothetical protein
MIMSGLVPSLAESQKVTLVDCLCHCVTSLVGRFLWCPIMWTRFVQHLLTTKSPSVSRRGLVCWQAHEPQEKNLVSILCLIGFLPVLGDLYCDWFIILHGGINIPLTPLLTCKVVVTSSLV